MQASALDGLAGQDQTVEVAVRHRGEIDRLQGDVLRGQLSASGRVAWAGARPWSTRFEARNIDMAGVRSDLSGRVSATATVEGRGFTPDAPWTARLASLSGTLAGRALTGRGEISHRAGTYDLRGVRIANGPGYEDGESDEEDREACHGMRCGVGPRIRGSSLMIASAPHSARRRASSGRRATGTS